MAEVEAYARGDYMLDLVKGRTDPAALDRMTAQVSALTGLDPGWRGVGGLRLATTPQRVEELRRQASSATTYGLDMNLLGPAETVDRLPLLA